MGVDAHAAANGESPTNNEGAEATEYPDSPVVPSEDATAEAKP